MVQQIKGIAILGDGGWGTTLAIYLSKKGYQVNLWGPFADYVRFLDKHRVNKKFLPGIKIPKGIVILDQLALAVKDTDLVVLSIPSKYALSVIRQLKKFQFSDKILLSVIKGIEKSTLRPISEIIYQELGNIPFAVLSGPTIAMEVASGIPSAAVVAAKDIRIAQKLQRVFSSESFRLYKNSDVLGVEIAGSVKNIIAIACGVCDGLGYGSNTKAAILTRGLAEMTRLGVTLGAQRQTFYGLSGLGDMVTTCFSPRSRNRSVGEQLGGGKSIARITQAMEMVAEGVTTVKAIFILSKKLNVSMPITREVYNIIYQRKNPLTAVKDLMTRELTSE